MQPMAPSRSQQMARIKSRNTQPEVVLRTALRGAGIPLRRQVITRAGRADLVAGLEPRAIIFIDGCFWHGCPVHYVPPRSQVAFWARKLVGNVARDCRQTVELEAAGFRVLRFWEHEIFDSLAQVIERVKAALRERRPARRRAWRVWRIEWLDPGRELERRWMCDLRRPDLVMFEERRRRTTKARWRRQRQRPIPSLA